MARSPFQGTYQHNINPTVVTGPDCIVYLNGEQEIKGCQQCHRSFNLNQYITSVSVDLSVEGSPGSASFQLSVPRHSVDDFYFDGRPILTPMMEVEIFGKGYYLVEGVPQYYPIFWGIVTEVSDSYSSGEFSVSVSCADILKWWDLSRVTISPAYTAPSGAQGRSIYGNVFAGQNPYDIIFTLAQQSFGDIVVGAGSMNALVREISENNGGPSVFDSALADMMAYWETRFSKIRSSLVLYGASGNSVRGDSLFQAYSRAGGKNQHIASTAVRDANGKAGGTFIFDPASPDVVAFKEVPASAGQVDLFQSEYQSKLEVANTAKDVIGFEFYMDTTGDIVFKPPFYNLDVVANKPVSWIQDIDIIDWNFSLSESDIVTQIVMSGNYGGSVDYGQDQSYTPYTTVTDYHLVRKYGWRPHSYSAEFMSSPQLMFLHGMDVMDRINSKQYHGSVTIPFRPEMRLGFPVYLQSRDEIWYVTGISHSLSFGGRATTSLTLTARRGKFIAPVGTGDLKLTSFDGTPEQDSDSAPRTFRYGSRELAAKGQFRLDVTNAATLPTDENDSEASKPLLLRHPKTGRVVGHPNVVMAYTRPFDEHEFANKAGLKTNFDTNPYVEQRFRQKYEDTLSNTNQYLAQRFASNVEDYVTAKYLNNRYQYGLNSAGVFVYARDSSSGGGVISETVLLPLKNIQVTPTQPVSNFGEQTAMIRPISDERGFELVGHYQYGRRLFLKDGKLNVGDPNTRVQVEAQLTLTGGLQETLQAQSQGITTVVTGYQDPASTIASLTPDDLETSGILVQGKPEFSPMGDNFVSTATLDSPERAGTRSVEASQLSRALTITELSVRDKGSVPDPNCVCLMGRGDLEFMAEGYQIKPLSMGASQDSSTLPSNTLLDAITGVDGGEEQTLQSESLRLQAKRTELKAQLASFSETVPGDPTEDQQAIYDSFEISLKSELEQVELELSFVDDAIEETKRRPSLKSLNKDQLVSRIETFLSNLYKGLDDPHQQHEKEIRGDLLPRQEASTFLEGQFNPPSELAPPFSAPNRFTLGDPKATAGNVQTNADNVASAMKGFSQNLRLSSQKAELASQISKDQSSVSRLTSTRARLQEQLNNTSTTTVVGVDLAQQVASLDKQIQTLNQNILSNQTKLSTL